MNSRGEHRRFGNRQTDVEPDQHVNRAREERKTPSVRKELFVSQRGGECEKHRRRHEESNRCTKLRKHAVPCASAGRSVFDGQEYRPAPLSTQPQALPEAAQREERRRRESN